MASTDPADAKYIPQTVVLDGRRLHQIRTQLRTHPEATDGLLPPEFQNEVSVCLCEGPWSVTTQKNFPPSGDKHDYASQAPYWWPPSGGSGPYERHDGKRNPEVDNYTAKKNSQLMFKTVSLLSIAWFYTGQESAAKHCGEIIRTWFIDSKTRMNPNLNHAQIIPGANTGRCIGIIDFSQRYTSVLDAVAILETGAPGWSSANSAGFRKWNEEFLDWLANSEFGREESVEKNNHGTFAIMQKAAIALFLGQKELAKTEVLELRNRIDEQIDADGMQALEVQRTRSWHYSVFNLVAFVRASQIGKKVGVDLWAYKGPKGQSLRKAIEFIIPAATGQAQWPFPELDFQPHAAYDVVLSAADAGIVLAAEAVGKLQKPMKGDFWQLAPAAQHFGAVTK